MEFLVSYFCKKFNNLCILGTDFSEVADKKNSSGGGHNNRLFK